MDCEIVNIQKGMTLDIKLIKEMFWPYDSTYLSIMLPKHFQIAYGLYIVYRISHELSFIAGISPRICFSNRPDLDQIVPDESIFLIGPIVILNCLDKVIGYCF